MENCYCNALRKFLDDNRFLGHSSGHQERCLVCVNALIEDKNTLVREFYALQTENSVLRNLNQDEEKFSGK